MNILFADQFGELGGAQQCLLDLLPAVKARGWAAYAAVPRGELATRLAAAGVPVEPLEIGAYPPGRKSLGDAIRFAWTLPRMARQLRRSIDAHRIDLLYVNGPRLLPAASLTGDLPMVFHAHSYLPAGVSRQVALAALRMRRYFVIAVSRYVAGYLYVVPAERIAVVPNGVADARRAPRRGNTPHIGIIGRIAPEKGQLDFIEAARLLPREWKFTICGTSALGSPELEEAVCRQAVDLPVDFPGWQEDIPGVLSKLDLLAVPSATHEGLGRVVLEAFSAGVPVVAYPSGGIPELVQDGETGFLVNPQTPAALAETLRTVMANEEWRHSVAHKARLLWASAYTLEHYRDGVAQIMTRAASRHSSPATMRTGG